MPLCPSGSTCSVDKHIADEDDSEYSYSKMVDTSVNPHGRSISSRQSVVYLAVTHRPRCALTTANL